ncbi:hypothetical protein ZEAMMB73_Zm00001d009861 [Zea mays]|uniref:Uncharacterized protein n=1 Tax=Zea mays TaxID=4577 RepID=A0A1D6FMF4_MAIZE|nr:hypothetical protein ZEAMMB73_Zm00001d009861 [Zea mays]
MGASTAMGALEQAHLAAVASACDDDEQNDAAGLARRRRTRRHRVAGDEPRRGCHEAAGLRVLRHAAFSSAGSGDGGLLEHLVERGAEASGDGLVAPGDAQPRLALPGQLPEPLLQIRAAAAGALQLCLRGAEPSLRRAAHGWLTVQHHGNVERQHSREHWSGVKMRYHRILPRVCFSAENPWSCDEPRLIDESRFTASLQHAHHPALSSSCTQS